MTTTTKRPARPTSAREHAAVERVEPRAPPPPREHEHEHAGRRRAASRGRDAERATAAAAAPSNAGHGPMRAAFESARPATRGADHDVSGQSRAHGTASPFRSAMRAGPIPGIASSASTDVNGPCCLAVGNDLLRSHRADAGQRVELLGRRRAERDRAPTGARRRPLRRRRASRAPRRAPARRLRSVQRD